MGPPSQHGPRSGMYIGRPPRQVLVLDEAELRLSYGQPSHRMARQASMAPAEACIFLPGRVQVLVLDEADLLLSYGYEEDLQLIAPQVGGAEGRAAQEWVVQGWVTWRVGCGAVACAAPSRCRIASKQHGCRIPLRTGHCSHGWHGPSPLLPPASLAHLSALLPPATLPCHRSRAPASAC